MEKLDFNPSKSTDDFRKNYKLHDMAEFHGKNLLTQWGIEFKEFGNDNRFKKVWEKGDDKPDLVVKYKSKTVLLDWKGKRSGKWLVNERAIKAYEKWSVKLCVPIAICFFVLDDKGGIKERRFAFLGKHPYILSSGKQWDKNKTIEFNSDIPIFNKANFFELLFESRYKKIS